MIAEIDLEAVALAPGRIEGTAADPGTAQLFYEAPRQARTNRVEQEADLDARLRPRHECRSKTSPDAIGPEDVVLDENIALGSSDLGEDAVECRFPAHQKFEAVATEKAGARQLARDSVQSLQTGARLQIEMAQRPESLGLANRQFVNLGTTVHIALEFGATKHPVKRERDHGHRHESDDPTHRTLRCPGHENRTYRARDRQRVGTDRKNDQPVVTVHQRRKKTGTHLASESSEDADAPELIRKTAGFLEQEPGCTQPAAQRPPDLPPAIRPRPAKPAFSRFRSAFPCKPRVSGCGRVGCGPLAFVRPSRPNDGFTTAFAVTTPG